MNLTDRIWLNAQRMARIQKVRMLILHCLCDSIDHRVPLKIQSSPKCKARENFAAPHMIDMLARNFFRNAAVGMKSGFLEVSHSLLGGE